jgi:cytochrome c peroxidase
LRNSRRLRAHIAQALAQLMVTAIVACAIGGCDDEIPEATPRAGESTAVSVREGPITPLPSRGPAVDRNRVELGRTLWFEPRMSHDGRVVCNDCHDLERAGTDGRVHSALEGRPEGGINVPSVYNLAYLFRFSWSGRFERFDEILTLAITSSAAMATTWPEIETRLRSSARLRADFARVYADGITQENVRDALTHFLLSLRTPDAPFDRWLRGDDTAISGDAVEGYALFRDYGCSSCHQGVAVGGNLFQRFGVMRDYFADRGHPSPADDGLFQGTHRESDRHVFRVPSLRNVAITAPYFHDGSAATLDAAVETMARYQLGRPMPREALTKIVAFLRTLTGRLDGSHH